MPKQTMHAVSQDRLGPAAALRMATVPRPEPGGTEVLVRVMAAGVNPVVWKTRAGGGRLGPAPFILGWDVAGVVAALGEGVTRSAVGTGCSGCRGFPPRPADCGGAWPEHCLLITPRTPMNSARAARRRDNDSAAGGHRRRP